MLPGAGLLSAQHVRIPRFAEDWHGRQGQRAADSWDRGRDNSDLYLWYWNLHHAKYSRLLEENDTRPTSIRKWRSAAIRR